MSVLKSAYVATARKSLAVPPLARFFERSAEQGGEFSRWLASLTAIYQLDRMVALDIPWWNIAATREIEAFLTARPRARVFEYGSGASTVWLAQRCGELVSIEHDDGWGERVRQFLAHRPHCSLRHRSLTPEDTQAYTGAIAETGGAFDLIIVDGRERAACLAAAIGHLAPGGIVLFDDSGRRRYRTAIESCGLEETHHFGRSYCVPYPDHTSLLREPADWS